MHTLTQAHQVHTLDPGVTKSGWTLRDPPNLWVGSLSVCHVVPSGPAIWAPTLVARQGHTS